MVKTSGHSPNLVTIKMIEKTVKQHNGEFTRTALWRNLPKQVMYQTYKTALNYLIESNKVMMCKGGFVAWIHFLKH